MNPGCLKWVRTAGKSLFLAYSLSIFTLNTYLTWRSDYPLTQTHQDERKQTTVNQGLSWLAPWKCFSKEWLNLSTSIFFQEITVCLSCSNKYLLLPVCNYWFYRESGREKINYSVPGIHFGKNYASQNKDKHCRLHSLLPSTCFYICACVSRGPSRGAVLRTLQFLSQRYYK